MGVPLLDYLHQVIRLGGAISSINAVTEVKHCLESARDVELKQIFVTRCTIAGDNHRVHVRIE